MLAGGILDRLKKGTPSGAASDYSAGSHYCGAGQIRIGEPSAQKKSA
jgi:hypothetical protein